MKTCSKCKETKELTEFYKFKGRKDGLHSQCKVCIKTANKANYEANKEHKKAMSRAYREANKDCPKFKERESNRAKAWAEANKDRTKANQRAWYEANKEHVKAYGKAWVEANRELVNSKRARYRAKKLDQTPELTIKEQGQVRDIYEACKALNEFGAGIHKWHVDHIVALANGGLHHPDNLQILTAEANLRKGAS